MSENSQKLADISGRVGTLNLYFKVSELRKRYFIVT